MNNQVTLVGAISSEFTYDHEIYGEKYYKITLSVTRDSGTVDKIPVLVSERLINIKEYNVNECVLVKGQYRSYNLHGDFKTKLVLFVFANSFEKMNYSDNYNEVFLEGNITRPPVFRQTPLGREIADIILAVPRGFGKTDYIPCVCWSRTAKYVCDLGMGETIRVAGRVQSRDYVKDGETKTAYEVSVSLVEYVSKEYEITIGEEIACRG